ncbi:MAG: hypothetical protein K6F00_09615 [Lachnospiraceae bacterium]|nr:hypothetical protein [Lachnospiraceae bacterium]
MKNLKEEKAKKFLAILLVIIILVTIAHIVSVVSFNQAPHSIKDSEEQGDVTFALKNREDSTSSWLKRDFNLYGETVDLKAQTLDATIFNNSKDQIDNWTMRINIKHDCFLNNAWCGKAEIHQYVGTEDEQVQLLDLRAFDIKDVKLDHMDDSDLLIPLKKGDFVIYYPSEKDKELLIDAASEKTIGMIFYYLGDLDLSDNYIEYFFHKKITEGANFYICIFLITVWIVIFITLNVSSITYNKTIKEMELRKSGISCMSDIYELIYILDLEKDELIPVSADNDNDKLRPKDLGAREQLANMFKWDASEAYIDLMLEFTDLDTLPDRLDKKSIVCEYVSKFYGWCQIRFFAMERAEGEPLRKAIFTLQVVNEEKQEMEQFEERITQVEREKSSRNNFYATMTQQFINPANTILNFNKRIKDEPDRSRIEDYTEEIDRSANNLISLANGLLDCTKLSANKLVLKNEDYSVKELIYESIGFILPDAESKNLTIDLNISNNIPSTLQGDAERLKQIITYLLKNAVRYTSEGSITLSLYGKSVGSLEHLLISVKDTGSGIRDSKKKQLIERFSHASNNTPRAVERIGLGVYLISGLLELMGANMNIISEYGEGSEFYFEILQNITNADPIGAISIEDIRKDNADKLL